MKNRALVTGLCCIFFIFSFTQSFAGQKLLEDWNTTTVLDAAWGGSDVQDQNIYVSGGALHHHVRPYSTLITSNNLSILSSFPYSTANNLKGFQSKIRIESIGNISSAPGIAFAAAEFGGVYYNINATPTSIVGDISFFAHFGDRGNGLEAWYVLVRNDAPDYSSWTELATGVFPPPNGGWQTGTDYILAIAYDGSNSFTSTLGGRPTDISPVVGPERGNSAWWATKSIITNVKLNESFIGDPDAYAMHAVYDDVQIDTGSGLTLHDNFNAADESLSTLLWDSGTLVRQSTVTNGMVKVSLKTASGDTVVENGFRYTVGLPTEHQSTDILQADMKIEGNTMQSAARARVAIGGVFGNGKYTTAGNGNDGAIQFNANVEKKVNSSDYRVICNSFMEGENLNAEVEIMWEHVPALPDTWYTATLSKTGNTLYCQIAETSTGTVILSASKDVTTVAGISPIVPVGETRELFVRDIYAPAEVIGYYDNVYVKNAFRADVNQDGNINLTDAMLALQIITGNSPEIPRMAYGVDVDGDNKIGLAEAVYVLQVAAQLPGVCGNNVVDPGEDCDSSDFNGHTCKSQNFDSGFLQCNNDCTFNTESCDTCGNGTAHYTEPCDISDFHGRNCGYYGFDSGSLACTQECNIDISGCKYNPICGNGIVEGSEMCDNSNLNGIYCTDLGYDDGSLGCTANCTFNFQGCRYDAQPVCGNGIVETNEACDSSAPITSTCNDFGFDYGSLVCTNCKIDKKNCTVAVPVFGDGITDPGEECDTGVPIGLQCSDFGDFNSGSPICQNGKIDTSSCSKMPVCGNAVIEAGESCDSSVPTGLTCNNFGNFNSGAPVCQNCQIDTSSCRYTPPCGNGIVEVGETCDSAVPPGLNCTDFGFDGGMLSCQGCQLDKSACTYQSVCGDGVVEGSEVCDTTLSPAIKCSDFGNYDHGAPVCQNCQIDISDCKKSPVSVCPNGIVDQGEGCDPLLHAGLDCTSFGFEAGTVSCQNCQISTAGCSGSIPQPICNDGIVQGDEKCDGSNLNNMTCTSLGFAGGTLSCNQCQFNTVACLPKPVCPNGRAEGLEECDGSDLNNITCGSFGFSGGTLSCTQDCKWQTDECKYICGNGIVDPGEQCDGANFKDRTCNSEGYVSGTLYCNSDCTLDKSHCTKCGNGEIDGSEVCDKQNLGGITCENQGYLRGIPVCSQDCKTINLNACSNCGDGKADAHEQCDGDSFHGSRLDTCNDFAGYENGVISCNNDCTWNLNNCKIAECGNGQAGGGESCDGNDLNGHSCEKLGYGSGSVTCNKDCSLNTSACLINMCGDNIALGSEVCDGSDLNDNSCEKQGFTGGTLKCSNDCINLDTTNCNNNPVCGNGIIEQGEQCDGPLPAYTSCGNMGTIFASGTLRCNSDCTFNADSCCTYWQPQLGYWHTQCDTGLGYTRGYWGGWLAYRMCGNGGHITEWSPVFCWIGFPSESFNSASEAMGAWNQAHESYP